MGSVPGNRKHSSTNNLDGLLPSSGSGMYLGQLCLDCSQLNCSCQHGYISRDRICQGNCTIIQSECVHVVYTNNYSDRQLHRRSRNQQTAPSRHSPKVGYRLKICLEPHKPKSSYRMVMPNSSSPKKVQRA